MIDQLHYISQKNDTIAHIEAIQQALESGCKWIQLRVKNQPENVVRSLAFEAKNLCDKYDAKLIINDFPQIAKEVSAYGVHLGLMDMPVSEARQILGDKFVIGGTANTYEDVLLRVKEGADYVGLGPFRFTTTKEKLSPILGLDGYKEVFRKLKEANITIPIVAIGGIEVSDIDSLIEVGLHGVALSGTITFANDREKVVKEILEKIKGCEVE